MICRALVELPQRGEVRGEVATWVDGQTTLDKLLQRLADVPTPAGPTLRQIDIPAQATRLPIVAVKQGDTGRA